MGGVYAERVAEAVTGFGDNLSSKGDAEDLMRTFGRNKGTKARPVRG
jgi:hypothetical protein